MDHYPDHQNPNPNNYSQYYSPLHHLNDLIVDPPPLEAAAAAAAGEFQLSDYLVLDAFEEEDSSILSQSMASSAKVESGSSSNGYIGINGATSSMQVIHDLPHLKCKNKRVKMSKSNENKGHRVAFRTKSELEVMDDGFKWRKYGKKSVKNSPNPRNYYKCSSNGCIVKKRVERDRDDSGYVITSYDGVHNHECPGVVCYAQSPPPPMGFFGLMSPNTHGLALEEASPHHSSSSS